MATIIETASTHGSLFYSLRYLADRGLMDDAIEKPPVFGLLMRAHKARRTRKSALGGHITMSAPVAEQG